MNIEIVKVFENLKPGWYNGYGEVPNFEVLQNLELDFNKNYNPISIVPNIYPVPEGGIRFEWNCDTYEFSFEINYHVNKILYCYYNYNTEENIYMVYNDTEHCNRFKTLNFLLEFITCKY